MALNFRQVHLDFHTSGDIPGIGSQFDPSEFAETLLRAHVNSITCFARGHHGYLYYDSKKFPERVHPHLANRNLLPEQIEACHKRGIRVPIYITVQWDAFTAKQHPEWLVQDKDGCIVNGKPYEAGFYQFLALNSPYVDFLKAQTREVLNSMPVDGIFFDIVDARDDSSKWTKEGMLAQGLNPADDAQRIAYGEKVVHDFRNEMTAFVRQFNRDCTVFYNAGNVGPFERCSLDAYSHFELESLPSGGWGYMHFPVAAAFARTLGKDCMGMTGKFHTSWGDFHSFKSQAALRFECMRMLSMNAKCSIGDQLLPHGRLCEYTYDLIGSVYEEVEAKEKWCVGAVARNDIGVLTVEEFTKERTPRATSGALRMLTEGQHQFDVLDSQSDFGPYRLIILPDEIEIDLSLAKKLTGYVEQGGSLITSYKSGYQTEGTALFEPLTGVRIKGEAEFSPDFIMPEGAIGAGLPSTEHTMYMKGMALQLLEGEVLAETRVPFFNRTWEHFCSHRHTPSAGVQGKPGIIRNGNVITFSHPIFSQYEQNAPSWVKKLFLNAVKMLLPTPLLAVEGPSSVIATVNHQGSDNRDVIHLLHFIPERRGRDFDVIEDVITLTRLPVRLRVSREVEYVRVVPNDDFLPFDVLDGVLSFVTPILSGHCMIEVQYI
jgi:hypothetical protein